MPARARRRSAAQGRWLALAACALLAACAQAGAGSGSPAAPSGSIGAPATAAAATASPPASSPEPAASGGDLVVGGDRPVTVQVPSNLDPATPAPLLIYLHGFGASGEELEAWLPLGAAAVSRGMVVAMPDGSGDAAGNRFWNATDACCDQFAAGTDDSAYLAGVIDEIQARLDIDPRRIYVAGHSNGAFMSYRMACDHADRVAAIVSIAGATWADPARCQPSEPVAILQIHGTADEQVRYEGGALTARGAGAKPVAYPGARRSIALWNGYDGCADQGQTSETRLDLEAAVRGPDGPAETTVETFDQGCRPGGHTELWSMDGASHVPTFTADAPDHIVDFLLAHPKP